MNCLENTLDHSGININIKQNKIMQKLNLDRVLIDTESIEKTDGGIYVTKDYAPGDIITGIIAFVGKGRITEKGDLVSMESKVGDKVMCEHWRKVTVSGKQYFLTREEDIILTL